MELPHASPLEKHARHGRTARAQQRRGEDGSHTASAMRLADEHRRQQAAGCLDDSSHNYCRTCSDEVCGWCARLVCRRRSRSKLNARWLGANDMREVGQQERCMANECRTCGGKRQALFAVLVSARALPVRHGFAAVRHILRGVRQGVQVRTVLCKQHEYGEKDCNKAITGCAHWNLLETAHPEAA
jgi:hypothetical protein